MIQVYKNSKKNTQEQDNKANAVNMMINECPDITEKTRIFVYGI